MDDSINLHAQAIAALSEVFFERVYLTEALAHGIREPTSLRSQRGFFFTSDLCVVRRRRRAS